MPPVPLLASYCALILVASLVGGWIPMWVRLTHTRLQVATSFVAGLMLGVGLLHLLPHACYELRNIDRTMTWVLGGFVVMFFVQRFLHFHHHDLAEETPDQMEGNCSGHDDHHSRQDNETLPSVVVHGPKPARQLSWAGAAAGLTLHTLADGVALAASVRAETSGNGTAWLAGLGTFLVIILHKPFDSMTIGALMAAGGWSRLTRHWVNAMFALAIPLGVVLFHLGVEKAGVRAHLFLGAALAFTAGSFLCIAASDLLPELQFHEHDRGKLSVALIAGLALALLVGRFEHSGHEDTGKVNLRSRVGLNELTSESRGEVPWYEQSLRRGEPRPDLLIK